MKIGGVSRPWLEELFNLSVLIIVHDTVMAIVIEKLVIYSDILSNILTTSSTFEFIRNLGNDKDYEDLNLSLVLSALELG